MKAIAVFSRKKAVQIIDVEPPEIIHPDEVKLRVLDVGLCGTDREIASFEYGKPPKRSEYLILGHECLAEVIEVGDNVRKVRAGDLVVPTVRRPCRHRNCMPCRSGYPDFCNTGDFTERGINGAHGFMTELAVEQEKYLHVLPKKLRDVGVLIEPLTISIKAFDQTKQIIRRLPWLSHGVLENHQRKTKVTAVVLGAGPVGLLGAFTLVNAGFETYVYARPHAPNPSSEIVEAIGAKYHSEGRVPKETRRSIFGRIHLIYEATGASSLAFEVLKILGPNSLFIFTGVPSLKGPIQIDADVLMRNIVLKNQVLFGTVNASAENFEQAIEALGEFKRRWPNAVNALITTRAPPDLAIDSIQHPGRGIKTVVTFDTRMITIPHSG